MSVKNEEFLNVLLEKVGSIQEKNPVWCLVLDLRRIQFLTKDNKQKERINEIIESLDAIYHELKGWVK